MGYSTGTNWDYEMVKDTLLSKGYVLIDLNYINASTKLTIRDNKGYFYYSCLSIFLKSSSRKFDKSNPYTIQNIDLWCKLNNKPFELISTTYQNAKAKLQWRCLKEGCGEIFYTNWSDIFSGNGCGVCVGAQVVLSNCLATKNPEISKEWHPTKNENLTPYDVTANSNKYAWWMCSKCGHEWKSSICSRNSLDRGCPECNTSKGEKRVSEWLENNNINNTPQKEFNGLVGLGNGLLSYDFYLPEYNMLIEYQGLQHKQYVKGFQKSIEEFYKQKEHDKRKKKYAQQNNINLLEIWYYDFDNVEQILSNTININLNKN